ncbi:uncharacterized protein LOC106668315 [Cimex lectularius]|uniref:Heparanase n=1 Tax=Cimex lectularius TaxID=79782 RepID=A0A8I6RVL5_CIMLE|nr:uncharacterized protein LOC106668315 [Cimex lectularius]XP_014252445.1 uncharacterized protein LOC106668315 [Cimex lectularius]XP_014252454.1 uncharacterized protein LOC106668315 [Cimex lectularius]
MNWFLFVLFLFTFYIQTFCEKVCVQTDTEKWARTVPPGFLSITVDPVTLLSAGPLQGPTLEMAKALSPAFVRICGEGTDLLHFGEELFKNNTSVTDVEIDSVMQFANNADLRVIVGLNPTERQNGYWNSENALKIMSYMNKKGYKASWQLGCGMNIPHLSGEHIATDILKLKKIVDSFPLFSKSLVLGPDFDNSENEILKDFLQYGGNSVSSVIISLKPQSYYDLETYIENSLKNVESSIRKQNVNPEAEFKKSVFLADAVASGGTFEQAKQLARTLGTAAALGCKMVFKKCGKISLTTPTPEFWFSALYKALVGRYVFNAKVLSDNNNNLHVYSQSTPTLKPQILDRHYPNGSLTLFGVNDSPDEVEVEVKDSPMEGSMHIFSLTTQLHGLKEVTLLNGRELSMLESKLPLLAPTVKKGGLARIPGNSIFFIVLPEAGLKTCSVAGSRSITKREIVIKRPELKQISLTELDQKYRNFAKNIYNKMLQDSGLVQEKKDDMSISFITYNTNGWLNDLLDHILPIDNSGNQVQSASTQNTKNIRSKRSTEIVHKENENFNTGNVNEVNTFFNGEVEDTQNANEDDQMSIEKLNQPIEGLIHSENGMDIKEIEDQEGIDRTLVNIAKEEEKLLNNSSQAQIQPEESEAPSSEEIENKADSNNEDLVMENDSEDVPYVSAPEYPQEISDIGKDQIPENIDRYDFPNLKTSYTVNPQVPQEPPMIPQYLPKHPPSPSNPNFISSHTSYPTQTSELILNEKKENAINSILTKIVSKENALYENKPVDPSKAGTVEEMDTSPLVQVVVPETDLDVYVPLNSLDTENEDVRQTLSPGDNLILPSNDRPTVKVQRQINDDPLYKNNPVKKVQDYLMDILNKVPKQIPITLNDLPEPNESNRDKVLHLGWPKKVSQPLPASPAQLPEMNDPLYTTKLAEAVRMFIEQKKVEYEAIKAKMASVRQKVLESSTNIINNEELSKSLKQRGEEIKTILKQMEPDGISSKMPIPLYIPSIRAKRSVKEQTLSDDSKLNVDAKQLYTHERMKRSFSEELDKLIEKARSWFDDINPFSSSKRSKRTPSMDNSVKFSDNDINYHDSQVNSIKFSQNSDDIDINSRLIKDFLLKKIKGNTGMYEFVKKYKEMLENLKKTEQILDSGSSDFQTSVEENTKENGILGKTDPCKDSLQIDGTSENSDRKDIAVVEFVVSSNGPEAIDDETFVKQLLQGMVMFFSMVKQLMEN